MNGEVYYCGNCRSQQPAAGSERCRGCGKITVSWYTNRETEAEALRKWQAVNG